jgi:hypothetical protein
MTADEFIAWAMAQPEGDHYELVADQVIGMAPERLVHVRTKQHVFRRLSDAIAAAGLSCEAFVDGMAVRLDDTLDPPGIDLMDIFPPAVPR